MTRYLHPYRMGDTIITTTSITVMTAQDDAWELPAESKGRVERTYGDHVIVRFDCDMHSLHQIHHTQIKFAPRGIRR